MRVERVQETLAACRDADDALHEVDVDLVAPVASGDRVLVHAGVAIARLQPAATADPSAP